MTRYQMMTYHSLARQSEPNSPHEFDGCLANQTNKVYAFNDEANNVQIINGNIK